MFTGTGFTGTGFTGTRRASRNHRDPRPSTMAVPLRSLSEVISPLTILGAGVLVTVVAMVLLQR